MRQFRSYGSVQGAISNGRPYRDRITSRMPFVGRGSALMGGILQPWPVYAKRHAEAYPHFLLQRRAPILDNRNAIRPDGQIVEVQEPRPVGVDSIIR